MPAIIHRATLLAAAIVALPVVAGDPQKKADPPPPAAAPRSAGQVVGELTKVSASSVALKLPELDRAKNSGGGRYRAPRLQVAYKDHDFDLAADVKVRWHELPKGPDGKAKQYTNAEYQKLIEPAGTPGYKADMSDLHTGQTVRLYLVKSGKDDAPVVATVMILGEATRPAAGKNDGKAKK